MHFPFHLIRLFPYSHPEFSEFDDGCGEGEIDLGNGICTDDESVASSIREIQAELAQEDADDKAGQLGRRFSMGGVDDFSSADNMRTKRRTQRLTLLMAKVEGQQRNVGKFRPREFMKKINGYGKPRKFTKIKKKSRKRIFEPYFQLKVATVGPNPTRKTSVTRVSHSMVLIEHVEHFTHVTLVSILITKIVIQSLPNTEQKLSRMATEPLIFNAVSSQFRVAFGV